MAQTSAVLAEAPSASESAGGIEAFHSVYVTHYNDVLRYCRYRLPTDEDAEDAAQEVFLHAYHALPRWLDRGSGMRSWLFSIAHNEVVSRYRTSKRRPQVGIEAAGAISDAGQSPEQQAMHSSELDHALRLLGELTEDQRRVMELRLMGLSGAEIAHVLEKRHTAVRKLQERAVERLTALRLAETMTGGESQ